MMHVVAFLAAENHRARKTRVAEFPVRTFAARNLREPGPLKLGNELANLAWHTAEYEHDAAKLPVCNP